MRSIHYKSNNVYLGMASFESFLDDALYFLEVPDFVFIGRGVPHHENINVKYCQENNIPMVRSVVYGRSYLFEAGKNLYVCLISREQTAESKLQEILIDALGNIGIKANIRVNDILFKERQLGMTSTPIKTDGGYFVGGQITFDADFDKVERSLIMPDDKWVDKAPATNIREWILPLSKISKTTIDEFVEVVKKSTSKILGVSIENGQFTKEELTEMTLRKKDYASEDWLVKGTH